MQSKTFIQQTRVIQGQQRSQVAGDESAWHLLPGHMTCVHAPVSVALSQGLFNRCSSSLARCLSGRSSFFIFVILSDVFGYYLVLPSATIDRERD